MYVCVCVQRIDIYLVCDTFLAVIVVAIGGQSYEVESVKSNKMVA